MAIFCTDILANTGENSCRVLIAKAKGLILVPMVNSSGVTPSIADTVDVDSAYVTAKINAANKLDRWFPVMNLKNVTEERGENEYFTYADGTREFNRTGVRTASFTRPSGTAQYTKKLRSWENANGGFYVVDENGGLRGMVNASGELEPFPFEDNTFFVNLVVGSDTQKSSSIVITFDYSNLVDDGDMGVILTNTDINLLRIDGLLDIDVTKTASTTTSLALTIDDGGGYFNDKTGVEGLLAADFALYNTTTAAAVTVITVTEPTPSNYLVTFAAQTSADVMRVTITKTGLETSVTTHTI